MATIKPFMAYRPCKGMEDKIAALPYDVYNRQEAVEVVRKNPKSFLAIDRAETQFDDSVDTYADCVYDKAKSMLEEWTNEGSFIQEATPSYYIYEQVMDGRSQKGIVACASIDDYQNNIIKKHEKTREDKELDRIRHVDTTSAQTGPIFLAYQPNSTLKDLVAKIAKETALYDFVSEDGIAHRVWVVSKTEDMDVIREEFKKMNSIYIADGHHRCASAVKVGLKRRSENSGFTGEEEFNFFLSVLFPADELMILDYNRVVKDWNGLSKEELLAKISVSFDVENNGITPVSPKEKGHFGMFLEEEWYKLTAKESLYSQDAVKDLDVSILQDNLLSPILGIGDPKTDKRIDFVGGIRGLKELERRVHSDMKIAFSMYPTSIYELFKVADEDRLMPPKSTWFEPKLRSGLFIHKI